ncbi:MAG: hypothetical protein AB9835_05745 [Eubacteriales bacterium]
MNEKTSEGIPTEITDKGHEAAHVLATRAVHWLGEKRPKTLKWCEWTSRPSSPTILS